MTVARLVIHAAMLGAILLGVYIGILVYGLVWGS